MLNKVIRKLKNHYLAKCNYIKYYAKYSVIENHILLESQQGKEYGGNIYYLIKELVSKSEYQDYKIFLSVIESKIEEAQEFYKMRNIENVVFIKTNTSKYFKTIASAKYLINDNTFLPFFIKKEEQIYLNTWHGTPLKTLGKKIKNDLHNIGNTQRNFVCADYLLYPNNYTKQHMIEDYMLENICDTHVLLEGYPRNQAFYDEELKKAIKEKYNICDKKIIAYMPTWRGTLSRQNSQIQEANLQYIFEELDKNLAQDQIVFVNLHPIEKATIDFSVYKKVIPFPKEYETYEFLNIADVLVTDYSSVFFDFLNTGKKIILYTYDRESYLSDRGLYRELESFPFPIVEKMEDLIREINIPKEYNDTDLRNEFCPYDGKNVSEKLCEKVILNRDSIICEESMASNGKKNVFIFGGRLANNGITMSLKNLLTFVDREKYNFYVLVETRAVRKSLAQLDDISQYVNYYPLKGQMNLTLWQKLVLRLYDRKLMKTELFIKMFKHAYQYELQRLFGGMKVDCLINFTGYSLKKTNLFSQYKGKKIIYVHSDMGKEIKTRSNQRYDLLHYAYNQYDKVAVVTKDMVDPTYRISGKKDNIVVCKNIIIDEEIREKSNRPIEFDKQTTVYPDEYHLKKLLGSDVKRFINVGRYSPEKGQLRLLEAFARIHANNLHTALIIIGGASKGGYYDTVEACVKELHLEDCVVLIKAISNPFPIIKQCDYFVMSSFYEGFGLVIAEADILNKPVISVNIQGPAGFMKEHGGTMVENSEDGIYTGMCMLLNEEIAPMNIDYKKYNKEALAGFEALIDD